jgi:3-hydroxybutyryl-CoA dehydratase
MNILKFNDIDIGLMASFDIKINDSMMSNFLAISGDINPLHLDSGYAKGRGFESVVVYGLLTSSFYSTLVGVYLPGKYCVLQCIDIEFSNPVYVHDDLNVSGKVTYINEAYKQIEIKAVIRNQKNKKVSKAIIKVGVIDE